MLVYVKERREGEREGGWQTQRGGEGFPEQGFSADSKDPGLGHFFLTREKPGGLGVNVPSQDITTVAPELGTPRFMLETVPP